MLCLRNVLLACALAILPATAQPQPEGHTVAVNGMTMYYETVGQGEPRSSLIWQHLVRSPGAVR